MAKRRIPNWPDYFADTQEGVYSAKGGKLRKRTPAINSRGYHTIGLYRDGKSYTNKVATLILETFVGPRPEGMECCHGIKGKLDDSLENLSWGTRSKNMGEDRLRDGILRRGESHPRAKLNREQILEARSLAGKMTQREIAKRLGVTHQYVSCILRQKAWAWL